jgi:type III secretion protein J
VGKALARSSRAPLIRLAVVAALAVLLSGCKVEIYRGLGQQDANDMLAVLLGAGIEAENVAVKDGVTLKVEEAQINRAIELLNSRGLPRPKKASMGEIFKQEGMVSSPVEQRARFTYAISEELSRTLGQLDGVVSARVHIVVPTERPNEPEGPASAAIFIKYRPNFDLSGYVPQIKQLVAHSVEGLTYDRVSVVLFPAQAAPNPSQFTKEDDRIETRTVLLLAAAGALIMMVLGATVVFLWSRLRKNATQPG